MLLNINDLKDKITGVFHVGAFIGEELLLYRQLNVPNIIFFEPVKHLFEILKQNIQNQATIYNLALGNFNGISEINLSEFDPPINFYTGASSSILRPKKHLEIHPNIVFRKTEQINVRRLDDLIEEDNIDYTKFNMMNIDVQGYELEVLKGAKKVLENIEYIITEVNQDETYENCAHVNDIDDFLNKYNLKRINTTWAGGIWGDALYVHL